MTKKTRYFLLTICVLIFVVLAPLIILYVRGITYDFQTRSFVKTGILAIRTIPNNPEVFLDGKLKSAGDIRFVLPGEHEVVLKKPGYFDWGKRLQVNQGQVEWASPSFSNVYLLFSQPPVQNFATSVLDFYFQNQNITYLTTQNISINSGGDFSNAQNYSLPAMVNFIAAADSSGKNFVLTNSSSTGQQSELLFFNADSGSFNDLTPLFKNPTKFIFGNGGQLFALNNSILYSVNPQAKTKTAIFTGVKAFTVLDGNLYYIQQSSSSTPALLFSQQPFSQSQTLFANLPNFSQAEIFVTFEKKIFLLADSTLYLSNNSMAELANDINAKNFSQTDSLLAIIHSGELDYFDPLSGNSNFVTRSSGNLSNFFIKNSIGYALYQKDNQIFAIELDTRDRQNQYVLYTGTNIKKFAVSGDAKTLTVLDGEELKSVTIR